MRYFVLVALFIVLWPTSVVHAQSGRDTTPTSTTICVKEDASDVKYPYNGTQCPTGYGSITIHNTVSAPFVGVCVGLEDEDPFIDEPNRSGDSDPSGKLSCDRGTLFAKNSIQNATPPNSNGNSNVGSNSGSGSGSGNGNNGGGGGQQAQGSCDNGFHEVGPLCVPNSPFNNSSGVAGAKTLQELITRVINILLFLAGVIAVIMGIIGGYYVMTAAGNATQATNGRKTVTNAVIGLVIVVMSYVIVQVVVNFITK